MQNTTPRLISVDDFNKNVRSWSVSIRSKIYRNAPVKSGSLRKSITQRIKKIYGESSRVTFNFERHGVFVHYGVGRGYIRMGNDVVPGRKLNTSESNSMLKRGDNKRDINKMRIVFGGSAKRKPNDWFDVEIKFGIRQLADIAQSYYGDKAMNAILQKIDKSLIQKK
jgi:hypothetical protein